MPLGFKVVRPLVLGVRPIIEGLLFGDSFDHYSDPFSKWTQTGSGSGFGINISSGTGYQGSNSAHQPTWYSFIRAKLPITNHYIMGVRWWATSALQTSPLPSDYGAITCFTIDASTSLSGSEALAVVGIKADGSLIVIYGLAGSLTLTTPPGTVSVGPMYYIELDLLLHHTNGAITLRVNEIVVASVTGVDTINQTYDTGYLRLGHGAGGANVPITTNFNWDDVYVSDGSVENADFQGDTHIQLIKPVGAGTYTQWLGSPSGNNWDRVNEAPPSTGDYVHLATHDGTPYRDTYIMQQLLPNTITVRGIQFLIYDSITTNGAEVKAAVRTAGLDGLTPNFVAFPYIFGNLDYYRTVHTVNPASGRLWSTYDVNNSEFGIYSEFNVPYTDDVQVAQFVLEVFTKVSP